MKACNLPSPGGVSDISQSTGCDEAFSEYALVKVSSRSQQFHSELSGRWCRAYELGTLELFVHMQFSAVQIEGLHLSGREVTDLLSADGTYGAKYCCLGCVLA